MCSIYYTCNYNHMLYVIYIMLIWLEIYMHNYCLFIYIIYNDMQIHCFIYVCLFIYISGHSNILQEKNILSFRLILGLCKTHENSFFFLLLDIGFFPCSTHTLPGGSVCLLQIKHILKP